MRSSKTAWVGRLEWNYSGGSVTVDMYTGKTDGQPSSAASGAYFSAVITVGGSTKSFSYQQQEENMYVGSVTVPVTGSTVTISGRVEAPYGVSMYGYPLSGSDTVTLYSQPQEPEAAASRVSVHADTVQMGKELLISISREDPYVEHYLTCWFNEDVELEIATNVSVSHVWTVPDLTYLCQNKTEEVFWIICYSYRHGEYLGWTEAEVTLTVPDPTIPSIPNAEAVMGTRTTISCVRNSSDFTVKLELEFQGSTISIDAGSRIDSKSWTPGYELAGKIPDLTYATGTLKCTTMNGTAVVGIKTETIRLIVPENDMTQPGFTGEGLLLTPLGCLPEAFSGVYLRGKTGLQAVFFAESEYSTIAEYTVTAGSQSAHGNPAVIDLLVSEGDVKVTARVTDARGFSAAITTTIPVLPYRTPRVTPCKGYSQVICERAEENGELSAKGTCLAIKAGKAYSSLVLEGAEQNRCVLRYRWKPGSGESYGQWTELLPENSSETEVSILVANVVSDLQRSYLVQIEAADTLGGSHVLTFQIMTEAVSFVLYDGEDGAGFGKYPESPHVVDIASHMTLRIRGALQVDGTAWQDLGLADGVTESAYGCGHKQEAGCHFQVWGGNHVYLAFDCSLGDMTAPVVINRTPIPETFRPRRQVYSLCPVNDQGIALVSADTDGYIRIQWVRHLTDTAPVIWLDGYLEYWI